MEKRDYEDYTFVIDKQLNNRYLKKYIEDSPCRNKIVSNFNELDKAYNLCNIYLKKLIQFFQKYEKFIKTDLKINFDVELQANEYNCGIIVKNYEDGEIANYLKQYENINYLQIKDKLYINNKYIDIYDIKRNYLSFHQNDNTVRKYLYNFINENIDYEIKDLVLFGGEMYLFQRIIKHENLHAYSDFESIINDTKYNSTNYNSIKLINYNTFELNKEIDKSNSLTICNTSKSGLGNNLCEKIKTKYVIIISCNKKSFAKDYILLKNRYHIIKNLEILNINIYLFNQNV